MAAHAAVEDSSFLQSGHPDSAERDRSGICSPSAYSLMLNAPHIVASDSTPRFTAYHLAALCLLAMVSHVGCTTAERESATMTHHSHDRNAPRSVAATPAERTDENSKIAHAQLLEKARAGGIDVYFLGDSITRRWGCTDPPYADLLANWNENFFGWNAANFGWGGDSTQNILWRIKNGELDGVHPKVIVIQGGTNNIGGRPGDDAMVEDISAGLRVIVETCRDKAPEATIIVTGIFPRGDNPDAYPAIEQINERLADFADGETVLYLNVNDGLADADGKLYDGMTVDGLHLSTKGYQVWADGLKPMFTTLLGPPAETNHAPPPTGDPSIR